MTITFQDVVANVSNNIGVCSNNKFNQNMNANMTKLKELNSEELSQLIGGTVGQLNEAIAPDVNNLNSVALCGCIYNNTSAISNTNSADKCACVCR